ncbi:hypothetical protein ACJX0J_014432, partial [Zea mays]
HKEKAIMPDVGADDIDNKFAGNLMPEAGPILLGALIGIYYTAMLGYELLWHKKPDFRELEVLTFGKRKRREDLLKKINGTDTEDFWDIIKKDIMKPICLLNSLTIGCQIFGFIKGRYILDGVKKQDGIILKIDFEKAEILIPLYMLSIFWAPKEDAMAGGKKDLENKEGLWQKIGTLISGKAFWKDNVIWLLDKKGFSCSSLDSLENKKRSLHLYIVLKEAIISEKWLTQARDQGEIFVQYILFSTSLMQILLYIFVQYILFSTSLMQILLYMILVP